jgi:iron(III) transport system ATP-binding protein
MTVALELSRVTVRRGSVAVLANVDLVVRAGEIRALLGPSGSGKSTLVRVALGLIAPVAGSVTIDGRVATDGPHLRMPPEERGIGVVFQDLALWPHLTVRDNLAFALRQRRLSRDAAAERIRAMLDRVGLAAMSGRRPGDLSGGERQRVAIARALVVEPSVVLLDEPLSNLDLVLKAELLHLFREVLRDGRCATLYVTHDPREAAILADRLALLEAGRITGSGTPDEMRVDGATAFGRAVAAELRRATATEAR